jgi:hypothetical protein
MVRWERWQTQAWQNRNGKNSAMKITFALSFLVSALLCFADQTNTVVTLGQPSIFWRNNEWEVFQNGQWISYAQAARAAAAAAAAAEETAAQTPPVAEPEAAPEPEVGQTNDYTPPVPFGYVIDLTTAGDPPGQSQASGAKSRSLGLGQQPAGFGQPNTPIGQPTIGPGQQTPGIGQQPTLDTGQQATGIRQPNVPLGQPQGQGQTTASGAERSMVLVQPTGSSSPASVGIGHTTAHSTGEATSSLGPR